MTRCPESCGMIKNSSLPLESLDSAVEPEDRVFVLFTEIGPERINASVTISQQLAQATELASTKSFEDLVPKLYHKDGFHLGEGSGTGERWVVHWNVCWVAYWHGIGLSRVGHCIY